MQRMEAWSSKCWWNLLPFLSLRKGKRKSGMIAFTLPPDKQTVVFTAANKDREKIQNLY